jgi:hypothetical protein
MHIWLLLCAFLYFPLFVACMCWKH